jgi:hypothetical protein
VGRGPEAPRWEHRRIPGRGCEGVCQAQGLTRTPACSRPMTSVSGSESVSASSRRVVRFRFRERPRPRAESTHRLRGAGIIWDVDPGWASFLGQPGAVGCNAFGVGEWTAGNAGSCAVGLRGGYSYSYSYSSRWDQGMESRVGHVGSSTSTALRAEYEYEYERESRPRSSADPGLSAVTSPA